MTEKAMTFPRKDGGPKRVVGKTDPHSHGEKWAKIEIHTGSRKALRCL